VASSLQGDQRTYHGRTRQRGGVAQIELDLDEGADIVMVKPALGYLDIVRAVADTSPVPVAAYRCRGSTR
jgi:porphobilinogen synthase